MATHQSFSVVRFCLIGAFVLSCSVVHGDDSWNTYPGREGIGHGKSVVLISGDEEYRSEEALSQLGKILSTPSPYVIFLTVKLSFSPPPFRAIHNPSNA